MNPEPQVSQSFQARAARYWALHAMPAIARETLFFAAAARVTEAISLWRPTAFMQSLSLRLEAANGERAQAILSGSLYGTGAILRNTADLVSFEQSVVQAELRQLLNHSVTRYRDEIGIANDALRSAGSRAGCLGPASLRTFHRVILRVRNSLGRLPDFALRTDRETIGMELALERHS